jgi:hypothetical protein
LIRHTLEAAKGRFGVKVCCGIGTDHLEPTAGIRIDDIIRTYEEQIEAIEAMDGRLVVMASRALAAVAKSPDDYVKVYGRILAQVRDPVIIHWLGEMFDPALAGCGAQPITPQRRTVRHHSRQRGKDRRRENPLLERQGIEMRRKLPANANVYRRRFQLPNCRRRRRRVFGRVVGYFRRHRPQLQRDSLGWRPAICRASRNSSRRCRCRGIFSGTDAVLQDRRRIPRLAQWLGIISSWRRQESARSLLHLAELFD